MFLNLLLLTFISGNVLCYDTNKIWDGFSLTYGPTNSTQFPFFNDVPRSEDEALNQGWTFVDNRCEDTSDTQVGRRYVESQNINNISVILIFDGVHKYIAGIQYLIPKDLADQIGVANYDTSPYAERETIKDATYYVFSTYFYDPKLICSEGRTKQEFQVQGTGTNLYIKIGSNTRTDSVLIPRTENHDKLLELGWHKETCIPAMGLHYLGELTDDMDCGKIVPYTVQYDVNTMDLISFSFFTIGHYPGDRFERQMTEQALPLFARSLPKCFIPSFRKSGGLSSLHVYFVSNPRDIPC